MLTITNFNNDHIPTKHINYIIEDSDWFLYFQTESTKEIVAISFVTFKHKRRGKILDITLLCAITNHKRFGNMMANAVYHFAIQQGCKFIYTVPRTPQLRETFIKYGFESICGARRNAIEVLEREIDGSDGQIDAFSINFGNFVDGFSKCVYRRV